MYNLDRLRHANGNVPTAQLRLEMQKVSLHSPLITPHLHVCLECLAALNFLNVVGLCQGILGCGYVTISCLW